MLSRELKQLQPGQQVFYRFHYQHPPYGFFMRKGLPPKVPATVIRINNHTCDVQYRYEYEVKYPAHAAGWVAEDRTTSAMCDDLFFTPDESDWCSYRGYTLRLVPRGDSWGCAGYLGRHTLFDKPNTNLDEGKAYIDFILSATQPGKLSAEIASAVQWWGNQIHRVVKILPSDDTRPLPTPEQVGEFQHILHTALTQSLLFEKHSKLTLAVDHPGDLCPLLADATQDLMESTLLPAKTVMLVKPGRVEVSLGYGAPFEVVFAA